METLNFKDNGCEIVRNMVDTKELYKHCMNIDRNSPDSKFIVDNALVMRETAKIQIKSMATVEKITGCKLYPTCNDFRIYVEKSILPHHVDRPACEISFTLQVGKMGEYNYPICIKDLKGKVHKVELNDGDALVYLGCELEHWRELADERVQFHAQTFIHYVDQDGIYADHIFDYGFS